MIINREPFVIPRKLVWLLMLAQIGTFGFIAQVLARAFGHNTVSDVTFVNLDTPHAWSAERNSSKRDPRPLYAGAYQ